MTDGRRLWVRMFEQAVTDQPAPLRRLLEEGQVPGGNLSAALEDGVGELTVVVGMTS